jgi:glycosyltransferase involved in cell wall biosynthesis
MAEPRAIHQFTTGFSYGDALGNQAAHIRDLLRGWGYRSQIYTQHRDHRLRDPGLDYQRYSGGTDGLIIYHYSIGSPLTEFIVRLPDRVVPYYHNVTPPQFLRGYNDQMADQLEQGRHDLNLFKDAPIALAASEYNRQEMLEMGFRQVEVLPLYIPVDSLLVSAQSPAGKEIVARLNDGTVNLLFVGRLVPNKRQDDLIRAFGAYHHLINRRSRLILVGSDAHAPGYRLELESLAAALDLVDHVHMPGVVSREELGGYYQAADLFLCLSEHEGFCIPLVEAMAFDLPVIAYRSTGVPGALGGSGVLISAKKYDLIAELIDMLVRDQALRSKILEGQHRRLSELAPDLFAEALKKRVQQMTSQVHP